MKKIFTNKILVTTILALVILIIGLNPRQNDYEEITFENGKIIKAKIAESESEKQKGLMNIKFLEEDEGMIFIYKKEQNLSFWMKKTLINLDIIFLDSKRVIVDIQTMKPCTKEQCEIYISKKPAMYAIEVNAGFTKNNDITTGQKVYWN